MPQDGLRTYVLFEDATNEVVQCSDDYTPLRTKLRALSPTWPTDRTYSLWLREDYLEKVREG